MPNKRNIALLFLLTMAIVSVTQSGSASAVESPAGSASAFLLASGSCHDICDQQCGGDCATAYTVGCTCYWFCMDGDEGAAYCGSAPIPLRICA